MKKKTAWIPWLTGLCMSTALMAAIFLFGDLKYAMNDDTAILRQYMGFGTGVIPEAHAFLHPLLSTPLRWLGLAAPEVPWFSWMQLTLLWLACMVSVKALMQCFAKRGFSMALGAAAGAVYLTLFGMTYACHVTFTITAAVLGAAAVSAALLHRWGALYRRADCSGLPAAGAGADGPVRRPAADLRAAGGPVLRVWRWFRWPCPGFRLWPEEEALVEAAALRLVRDRAGAGSPAFVARGQNEGCRDGGLPELAERQRPGGGLLWNQGPDGRRAGAGGLDAEGGQPAGPVVLSGQRADRRKLPPAGGRAGQPVEG